MTGWMNTAPTAPGWYWGVDRDPGSTRLPRIVEIYDDGCGGLRLIVTGSDGDFSLMEFPNTKWLGPLETPSPNQPPKEKP